MLIIPIEKGLDWSRAPVVTAFFVLLNCLIYLTWQTQDQSKLEDALTFYAQSSLPKIEYSIYISHLHQHLQTELADQLEAAWKANNKTQVYAKLITDRSFSDFLNKTTEEFWGEDIFQQWQTDRTILETKVTTISVFHLGLIPYQERSLTYLTYQFLHGDIWHLLGNMIVLAIVGMGVEAAIGSLFFLIGYIFCGVLAGVAYGLITPDQYIPLVGASGSISALMGMYAVIYGIRKIRFFYFVFFYFGYFTAPALAILPVWLLIEIIQAVFNTDSFVAYWAHAGGLVAGSALLFATKKWVLTVEEEYFEEVVDEDATYRNDLNRLMQQISQFNFESANRLVKELLQQYPEDLALIEQQYNLSKLQSDHEKSQRLLESLLLKKVLMPAHEKATEALFLTYTNENPDTILSQETRLKLLIYLIGPKTIDTAEQILRGLVNEKVNDPRVLKAVHSFIRFYDKKQDNKTRYRYQQLAEAIEQQRNDGSQSHA
ncbi:MAG: rhomboid family intramembrane serine protease [Pseudomonadales bacterium]|nr:rhomboid family intramembrane serine protease [Pseudomonadales bacterium]